MKEHKKHLSGKQLSFLQKYPIQSGDILLLRNEKIAVTTMVELKNNETFFSYKILRTNISLGRHISNCQEKDIFKMIPAKEFEALKTKYDWQSIEQLKRFFERNVKEVKRNKVFKSPVSSK